MTAFLFDMDDTMYDQTQPFCSAFKKTFSNQIPSEGLFVAYRKYSDEVFEDSENGLMSMEQMYIYRMSKAMEAYGIPITEKEALSFQEHYRKEQNHIVLSDDMKQMLDFCRRQSIKCGVISNGPADHQARKIQRLGIPEWIPREYIFISGAVGAAKPDGRIFSCAQERMQLSLESTYYIGDSYANDVVGAKQAGWKAVWFNRRGHQLSEQSIQPDHVVSDEKQLIRLIQSLVN